MKTVRITLTAAGLALAAGLLPSAASAQFSQTPWSCHPQTHSASGISSEHRRYSGLPFAGGGTAFYTVRFGATAVRCRGRTRIEYRVYLNTNGFPRERYVIYQVQSGGKGKKYRSACVKLFDSDERRCLFKLEANQAIPRFGAVPIYQVRENGVIRYVRMPNVAEQTGGGGTNLASLPLNIEVKLSSYSKRPRSLW